MNQEKIGKHIAMRRKQLNLTQEQLASKLNISNKTISRWENGNSIPDLSLFKPLCDILKIPIMELINGEKINKEKYEEIIESNIMDTIDYSNGKYIEYKKILSIIFLAIGFVLYIVSNFILDTISHVNTLICIIGIILVDIGIFNIIKNKILIKTIFISLITIISLGLSLLSDYLLVKNDYRHPMWNYYSYQDNKFIKYETPLYDYYIVNYDNFNSYTYFDKNKDISRVKFSPFNEKSHGIKIIKQYRKDIEKLITSLPLGFSKQYTLNNNELIISYETINEDFLFDNKLNKNYFKQVVIYNSIVIYLLRDDIETITIKLDETYRTKKSSFIELYPYFDLLMNDVDLEYFNEIVTYRLYDNDFVDEIFSKISN